MPEKAIAVLGMHRSGTSALARGLHALGAWMGEEQDLMGPAPDNPEGFWERWDIMEFHDQVLAHFNKTWDGAAPLPDGWDQDAAMTPFKRLLDLLIQNNFKNKLLWAFKDPRACLLLPLWKQALEKRGASLRIVLSLRHPLDVAASLNRRNNLSLEHSLALWELHYRSALDACQGLPLVVMHYDRVLAQPEREFRRMAKALDIPAAASCLKGIQDIIRPVLRHHGPTENKAPSPAPPPSLASLYAALDKASQMPGLAGPDESLWDA